MAKRRINFSRTAQADLITIHEWIEQEAGAEIADAYQARIEARCLSLTEFPYRGTPRDDLLPGVRSVSFERRIRIFYIVEADVVRIRRVISNAREATALD